MVQVSRYARGHITIGTLDASHEIIAAQKGRCSEFGVFGTWAHRIVQATAEDIEIIYDVCWMLSPMQIQRMCTNYYVADYEVRRVHQSEGTNLLTEA